MEEGVCERECVCAWEVTVSHSAEKTIAETVEEEAKAVHKAFG